MKRGIIASVLAASLCLGYITPAAAAQTAFQDVPGTHWAAAYIRTAAESSWVSGVGNQQFRPEQSVTGADFVTMVTRMLYPDEVKAGSGGPWYAPYQAVANQHQLLSDGSIDLNPAMTRALNRQEMAFMVAQAAKACSLEMDAGALSAAQAKIPDLSRIPTAYQPSVGLAYGLEILSGVDGAGTFAGTRGMTRAQAAVALCRLHTVLSEQGKLPSGGGSSVPGSEVTIGKIIETSYEGVSSFRYAPSSGIWTGEREGRAYGFQVNSIADVEAAFASAMDHYPSSLTFFSEKELDLDPSALCEPYELSHGLLPRNKGICYEYFYAVPKSLGNPYRSSAGEYYEYYIGLYYGAPGIVQMYEKGILDTLPNHRDLLFFQEEADYSPLLNAKREIESQYGITENSPDYDKVLAIYQYVTSQIRYDDYMASLSGNDLSDYVGVVPFPAEINFALTYKKGVCFEYALLFQALCCSLGVNCYTVDGRAAGGEHIWNIVEVDGAYYHADPTWDAGKEPAQYRYFLISDRKIQADHTTSTTNLYDLPACLSDY